MNYDRLKQFDTTKYIGTVSKFIIKIFKNKLTLKVAFKFYKKNVSGYTCLLPYVRNIIKLFLNY